MQRSQSVRHTDPSLPIAPSLYKSSAARQKSIKIMFKGGSIKKTMGRLISKFFMSHPDSRSDPIDGSEPGSEAREQIGTFFFFKAELVLVGMAHILLQNQHIIYIYKRTTTGVVSIKIYTPILSPIYKYKTVLLHLQIRARNLHVVNPYKCVGPAVCGCFQTSSPVPTRIKNPC